MKNCLLPQEGCRTGWDSHEKSKEMETAHQQGYLDNVSFNDVHQKIPCGLHDMQSKVLKESHFQALGITLKNSWRNKSCHIVGQSCGSLQSRQASHMAQPSDTQHQHGRRSPLETNIQGRKEYPSLPQQEARGCSILWSLCRKEAIIPVSWALPAWHPACKQPENLQITQQP